MDHLGLVQAIDGFGQGIVIGVAHAAHRGLDPSLSQALRIADRDVLHATVAVMDQAALADRSAGIQRLFQRIEHKVCAG
ncbi:hypothetical protein D3C85_1083610 [compost metagenome]